MEQKLIKLNHLIVVFCWLSFLLAVVTTLFSIGNIWEHIGLFLITPFRYLIFEIYPKEKEESFRKDVDRLMPFSTLASFISRPHESRQQQFLNYLGGAFWFLATLIFNGYHLLFLDTIRFHKGESVTVSIRDEYDELGERFHLYSFQIQHLRQLGESENQEDQEKYQNEIQELNDLELAKTLSPLGLAISQEKVSRYQTKEGTFKKKDYE